ncbi:MAG: Bsp6I family type II restriction endonuclease [Candidatus Pacebacteria bacterium]|nr:Bsp6I family type II restriction endonuclease [Candidatus Paceibacterota bacterium]
MKTVVHHVKVFGKESSLELMDFTKNDGKEWKVLFDKWKQLKLGLREYKSREPNLPEGLSEVAFCLYSGSKRFISLKSQGVSASFDTFNLETGRAEQVKASSVEEDLSSFGPKSKWDDLYFLDFYNGGKLDGTFNVYKIPTELIHSVKVNMNQTFKQQQAQLRRPRFSITAKIIREKGLKPVATNVKVW